MPFNPLNQLDTVPSIRVVWPDGSESERLNVAANQRIVVSYPDTWSID